MMWENVYPITLLKYNFETQSQGYLQELVRNSFHLFHKLFLSKQEQK